MPSHITYWSAASGSAPIPEVDILSETRTISGTSAQSGAAPEGSSIVSIYSTEAGRFAIGDNPTAAATSPYIGAGERIWRSITPGQKIAGITA